MTKKLSQFTKFLNRCKSVFMHGFFTLLPIAITFGIIRFAFRLIKSTLAPVYNWEPVWLTKIPHSEIFLTIMVIFILGLFFDLFLLRVLHTIEDKILNRIPLFRQVYFGVKQLVAALSPQDKLTFKNVVMVEFPRAGIYSLGFLTNEVIADNFPALNGKHFSIFIPTTPNPTTGFYIIVPEASCQAVNLTRQEAMALIISGGIIQPSPAEPSEKD